MATVEELDRLRAIIKQLGPLAGAQVGELIRAEDWNTAIGALQSVARALVADRESAVAPHEHPDQVGVGWLDPRLRQLVEQGQAGDPAALARVAALERGAERLQEALSSVEAELDDLRTRSRDIATRDLDRQAAVNIVRRKLEGVADARDDVAQVRTSLATVHERLTRAVELAENLQDGGEPVDLGGLNRRVGDLAKLRDGLTLPSGEVLDAQAFERRLAEIRNELVTQDELKEAIEDVTPELPPQREAALKAALAQELKADLEARDGAIRERVTAQVDAQLATVGRQVDAAVSAARPGIIDAALAATRAELDARAVTILTAAGQDADTRVKASAAVLRQEVTALASALRAELPASVSAELDARLPARLAQIAGSIDALARAFDDLKRELAGVAERIARTEARVDELARSTDERFDRLSERLEGVARQLEEKFSERMSGLERRVARLEGRTDGIDIRTDPRFVAFLDERDAKLRAELAGIAGDQVAGLQDRLKVLVADQVGRAQDDRIRAIATETVDRRLSPQ